MAETKKRKLKLIIILVLCVLILGPALFVGVSFLGRVTTDSVIPDSFQVYAHVPDPVEFIHNLLDHRTLPEILSSPAFAPFVPVVTDFRASGILDNFWLRFAGKGPVDGALLSDGRILAAWDMGVMSSVLKVLPWLAGQITVPNLYYVQAGKNSRFEYRLEDGQVFFIGPYKNLLIISNNSRLFESVIAGTSREGDVVGAVRKVFSSQDYDAAFLVSSEFAVSSLAESDPLIGKILAQMKFPGAIE
jgi:hypothetical protein